MAILALAFRASAVTSLLTFCVIVAGLLFITSGYILAQKREARVVFMLRPIIDAAKKLASTIGRRGTFLLFMSLVGLAYGFSLLNPATSGRIGSVDLFLPEMIWGMLWVVSAAACAWQAFVRLDRVAFTMVGTLSCVWGLANLGSWLVTTTNPYGWISGILFLGLGFLVGVVAYWPEPRRFDLGDL